MKRFPRPFMLVAASLAAGMLPAPPPPRTPEEARRREFDRKVNAIVYAVCVEREADAVQIEHPDGPITVALIAADPKNVTPAEVDDFQERLELAMESAIKAKSARLEVLPPQISEAELDKVAASLNLTREQAKENIERLVGSMVTVGEVERTATPKRQSPRRQPVRRARSARAAARKASRRR